MSGPEIGKLYRSTFGSRSIAGKQVLADLKAQFYSRELVDSASAHATVVAAAQADVVQYILDMIEAGEAP